VIKLTRPRQALILLLLVLATLLLVFTDPADEPVLRALVPSPVVVAATQRVDLYPQESVSGYLKPTRRVWLRFEVDGRVAQRQVEPGQEVASGDILMALEYQDYRDAMIQAQAELRQEQDGLERDKKLLELAERSRRLQEEEVARLNQLGERSMASKTRLGEAQVVLAQRQSDEARLRSSVLTGPLRLAARQAAMDRAQRDLDRTILKAPFAGRINRVELDSGDYASRNQQAVELISEQLDFYAQVRGPVARALSLGQKIRVQVGGETHTAVLTAVQPDPDPATFTHAIGLRMPESETRSGAAARAQLPLEPLLQALVVPSTAVLREEGGAFLFRVDGERLQKTPVELGPRVGQQQVINSGVDNGVQVVVRDVAALADQQTVVAEPAGSQD